LLRYDDIISHLDRSAGSFAKRSKLLVDIRKYQIKATAENRILMEIWQVEKYAMYLATLKSPTTKEISELVRAADSIGFALFADQ